MSGTGVDSMFFSDVTTLAEEVDEALVCMKSGTADAGAVAALSTRLAGLQGDDAESVALELLLTMADRERRGVPFWLGIGQRLAAGASADVIAVLESLAQSLEREQARLEERLRKIG